MAHPCFVNSVVNLEFNQKPENTIQFNQCQQKILRNPVIKTQQRRAVFIRVQRQLCPLVTLLGGVVIATCESPTLDGDMIMYSTQLNPIS